VLVILTERVGLLFKPIVKIRAQSLQKRGCCVWVDDSWLNVWFFDTLFLLSLAFMLLGSTGSNLLGKPLPDWDNDRWINSSALTLSDLKGKVVLLRFFMDSTCPFCRASAPYLNELFTDYKDKGVVIIGMYTPKPEPSPTDTATVQQYVRQYGFKFPVAIDDEWRTLRKLWLHRVPDADFTSVSFLIDKKGILRFIHPGGAYNAADVKSIRKMIEQLVHER
jgi:peroxiredoxin